MHVCEFCIFERTDIVIRPRGHFCFLLKGSMMARMLSRATITLMYRLLSVGIALLASTAYVSQSQAGVVTFGTGANQFQMEFVTIGNPGNAGDTNGGSKIPGSVAYEYAMGKFEVSRDMITKYNAEFGISNNLEIGMRFSWGSSKPAASISWNEAARFVNWLNTSTDGFAAYKFNPNEVNKANAHITLWTAADTLDFDPANPYRSKRATYVLPSTNEWYKAAYYDPNKPGGPGYWNFATGSDAFPIAVASGTAAGTDVWNQRFYGSEPADVDQAGGLSPYGVMGMGGNVMEWHETADDYTNNRPNEERRTSRGWWREWNANALKKGADFQVNPGSGSYFQFDFGFRVASLTSFAPPPPPPPPPPSVPEPSTLVIGTLFGLGGLLAKRRIKR
jgi:formylglycine-generating enzyme required for sulfatase activity